MTKLCPRGKAAAKRKFKVYPSAYANAYASKICAGKIKDPSGVKRKDFRGPKPAKAEGGRIKIEKPKNPIRFGPMKVEKPKNPIRLGPMKVRDPRKDMKKISPESARELKKGMEQKRSEKLRQRKMGGGMMQMPRAMYKKGGKSFPDLSGDGKVTMKDILMGRGVIKRPKKKGGGLMEATSRLRAQGLKKGGIARGCGAVMSDRRKKTKMY